MERTTDLEVIRKHAGQFTWGTILKVHDFGPYTIVEYTDRSRGDILFHVYVDGKSTSNSSSTLEGAILLAIARKNLEPNTARFMAMGACKLLGVKED
jgi:hypothetical protein